MNNYEGGPQKQEKMTEEWFSQVTEAVEFSEEEKFILRKAYGLPVGDLPAKVDQMTELEIRYLLANAFEKFRNASQNLKK